MCLQCSSVRMCGLVRCELLWRGLCGRVPLVLTPRTVAAVGGMQPQPNLCERRHRGRVLTKRLRAGGLARRPRLEGGRGEPGVRHGEEVARDRKAEACVLAPVHPLEGCAGSGHCKASERAG